MNKLKIIFTFLIISLLSAIVYLYYHNINSRKIEPEVVETTLPSLTINKTSPVEMVSTIAETEIIINDKAIVQAPVKTDPAKNLDKSDHQIFKDFCKLISEPKNITMKDNLGHKNDGLNFPKSKMYQVIDNSKGSVSDIKVTVELAKPPKGVKIQYAFCEGVNSCEGDKWYQFRVGSKWQNSNSYTLEKKEGYRTVIVDFKLLGVKDPLWQECSGFRDNEAGPQGHFRFQFINSSNEPAQ